MRKILSIIAAFGLIMPIMSTYVWSSSLDELSNAGLEKYHHGDFKGALAVWEEGLSQAEARNNPKDIATFCGLLGIAHGALSDYPRALALYAKALALARETGAKGDEGIFLNRMGAIYSNLGDYALALEHHRQALAILREIGDRDGEGSALGDLGIVYCNMGDYPPALEFFSQALAIKLDRGDKKGQGMLLGSIGVTRADLGDFPGALEAFRQAIEIKKEVGDQLGVGIDLGNVGRIYLLLGDYPKALDHYRRGLAIKREIGDRNGEAADLANVGAVYHELGDTAEALNLYQQALIIKRQIGDKKGQALMLGYIGQAHAALSDQVQALDLYQQALAIYLDIGARPEDRQTMALIGDAHLELGDLEQAAKYYRETGEPLRLGRLSLVRGDFSRAVSYFEESLKEAEETRRADFLVASLIGLGLSREGLDERFRAREYFERAVHQIEDQREGLTEAQRARFYEGRAQGFPRIWAYEGLARVLAGLGQFETAFQVGEETKARLLSEALARQGSIFAFRACPESPRMETELVDRLVGYRKMLERLFERKQLERYREIEKKAGETRRELEALIGRLRKENPEYAAIKYPQPYRADQVALQAGEVLLTYQVMETGVLWLLVRAGKVAANGWTAWPRRDLTAAISDYRRAFENVGSLADLARYSEKKSQDLYRRLLAGPLAQIQDGEKIVLVPDGILGLVPFETLIMDTAPARYVVDRHDMVYAHSGTSLTISRTLQKKVTWDKPLFVLADPVFSQDDARVKYPAPQFQADEFQRRALEALKTMGLGGVRSRAGNRRAAGEEPVLFSRLEETGRLAAKLADLFGRRAEVLTGPEATRENLLGKPLAAYRYLVLATHGVLDQDVPYLRQPALVLSQVNTNNGFLTLTDIMGAKLSAEVAALTACQTGLGKAVTGEGVMNLGRGFQYAGARSVLASLWSVDEGSTTFLVERFFTYLDSGMAPRDALGLARRDLRQSASRRYDHPFFWGAFILIGG